MKCRMERGKRIATVELFQAGRQTEFHFISGPAAVVGRHDTRG
eukprot:gene1011-602_t